MGSGRAPSKVVALLYDNNKLLFDLRFNLDDGEHRTDLLRRICDQRRQNGIAAHDLDSSMNAQEALDAADNLVKTDGHLTGCRFQGCTCGRTEAHKIARADYIRLRRDNSDGRVSDP